MKLSLNDFQITGNSIRYFGGNHYTITDAAPFDGFTVTVEALDDDGYDTNVFTYAASTLSAAIATVEALENGEEI